MTIKITLGRLYAIANADEKNGASALSRLAALRMPALAAYNLVKIVAGVNAELRPFIETRNKLIQEHGKQLDDGGFEVKPGDRGFPKYAEAMMALTEKEIELPQDQIAFESLKSSEISASDLALLEPLISHGEASQPAKAKPKTRRAAR